MPGQVSTMDDDLSQLGVIPSDRKKLENMGITKLEQLAIMSASTLGMGATKGNMLIQRARNILANLNIIDLKVVDDDTIHITVEKSTRAVHKSVLNSLNVYAVGWGNAALKIDGNTMIVSRKSKAFDKVVKRAEELTDILASKRLDEFKKRGIYLPENKLKSFAKKRGFNGFWENVFGEIQGNDIMKQVITTSLFSTFTEPVHSLIIGEPGSSKTMAKELISEQFTNITNIGANTTRSGLVCNLGTGDLGALPHSNHKVVLVDEFDKIPSEDIEYCYELLSNGKCSVHSAKLHQNIESKFIMIAFANPRTQVFTRNALTDIGLSPLLISRCALIIKVQNITREERLDLFRRKFYGDSDIQDKQEYYDQWVKLARRYTPKITATPDAVDQYINQMNDIVETHYATTLRRDLRMTDYIRRIPMSIARSSFSPVNNEVIKKAGDLIQDSIETWTKEG
jgi:hypothetical protein